MLAMRSQLTFYKESIRQKQPRPRFHLAFRLLWVLLSRVWSGWKSAAELMKPKTVLQWHERAFLQWCAGNLDGKEAVQPSARKCER
jgi:putative transposase